LRRRWRIPEAGWRGLGRRRSDGVRDRIDRRCGSLVDRRLGRLGSRSLSLGRLGSRSLSLCRLGSWSLGRLT
ncbi:MAG TPA: hypothetical protein PLQ54_14445, partial [Armatimonadota bacterium]|nr:hypothetical protein [Armatimonadota bacterium]